MDAEALEEQARYRSPDRPGGTGDVLTLEHIKPKRNGRRTRCSISEGEETHYCDTGDHANLAVAVITLALPALLRRRRAH